MKPDQGTRSTAQTWRSNSSQTVKRVVMESDRAAQRIRDRMNTRALVIHIRNGDVVAIWMGRRGRDYCAAGAAPVGVVDERSISRVTGEIRSPVVNRDISREGMTRTIGLDDHAALINTQPDDLPKAERPTRGRPVAVAVVGDGAARAFPSTGFVG